SGLIVRISADWCGLVRFGGRAGEQRKYFGWIWLDLVGLPWTRLVDREGRFFFPPVGVGDACVRAYIRGRQTFTAQEHATGRDAHYAEAKRGGGGHTPRKGLGSPPPPGGSMRSKFRQKGSEASPTKAVKKGIKCPCASRYTERRQATNLHKHRPTFTPNEK